MSRNTIIIVLAAVVLVVILFGVFGDVVDETPTPEAGTEAPAAEATE